MTLPDSGAISFAMVATELGRTGTTVTFSQADVCALVGKTVGSTLNLPNDFYGKSAGPTWTDIGNVTVEIYPDGGTNTAYTTIAGLSSGSFVTLIFSVPSGSFQGSPGAAVALLYNGGGVGTLAQIESDGYNYYLATSVLDQSVENGDVIGIQVSGPPGTFTTLNVQVLIQFNGATLEQLTAEVNY